MLLTFEQLFHDILTLRHCLRSEVLAQEVAQQLHLRVHHLAIGTNDIGCQHQQREQERVALSLIRLPLPILLIASIGVAVVILAVVVVLVGPVHHVESSLEQRTQHVSQQCPQRARSDEPQEASNPFSYCHLLVFPFVSMQR